MHKLTSTKKKSHPPINSSKSKKTWKLFKIRDIDDQDEIICTLCDQPIIFDDTNDYQMTIGHINYPSPEYENIYNTNDEVNLTPQHSRCNKLLQGKDFYNQHKDKLLKTLQKNIAFSKSQQKHKLEFSRDNSVLEDSSSIQDKKSKIYDATCEQYLSEYLVNPTSKIEFDTAKNDITGIVQSKYGFGSEVSTKRHLIKTCSRFVLKYVIEPNEDSIKIIRLMRSDEKEQYKFHLNRFENKNDMKLYI